MIVEDDVYLAPEYLERMAQWLDEVELRGELPSHLLRRARASAAAPAQYPPREPRADGVRKSLAPHLAELCLIGTPYVDLKLWRHDTAKRHLKANETQDGRPLHVSMKCLPGEAGIGIGHRMRGGQRDGDFSILRALLGPEASRVYEAV